MKIMLLNFLSVLRSFKMAATLNVAGLAVAFAAFVVILMQVGYERNFDRCHPTSERVFRVDLTTSGTFSVILPRAFIEALLVSSAHIESGTLINPFLGTKYFSVQSDGQKRGFREDIITCHAGIVETFGFPIIEGDPNCLLQPDNIIIPESMARKLFGDKSAVGQSVKAEESLWSKNLTDFTVGAVYRDLPTNTQIRNVIYTAINPNFALTNFQASNYVCYLLLDDAAAAQSVADNFNANFDFKKLGYPVEAMKLTPLTDIYYMNESQDGTIFRSGNREVTGLLLFIAVMIIIIAAINFTNFSTALTPFRIKSINTQKVLGSSVLTLRLSLLAETVIICIVSWLLSILLVGVLDSNGALPFISARFDISNDWPIVLITGFIAMVVGLVAGLYPSMYVTSFPPALVLKGSFGLSASGRKLRTVLIGIQFVVSIVFIIAAGFVRLQNSYMRGFSLGFDKDQIAIVELNNEMYSKHHETYANRLKEFSGIDDVAFSMQKLGSQDGYSTNVSRHKDVDMQYFMLPVSPNFLTTMGIPVNDGRNFTEADAMDSTGVSFIFNRSAKEFADMEVGEQFDGGEGARLIGFTDNVKFTSLRQGDNNIGFVVMNQVDLPVSYIRLKAGTDPYEAVDHIRRTLTDLDPAYPFVIEFYDTVFGQLYHKEDTLRSMITMFSLLAIIISLVGVFGLVAFETQYRRKEIGVRKIMGATVSEILVMFNRTYFRIVAICFVIAAPVAWYGVTVWLEDFAYKTPIYWWMFAIALVIVTAITIGTVTFQNWKTANANPVDSIKSE